MTSAQRQRIVELLRERPDLSSVEIAKAAGLRGTPGSLRKQVSRIRQSLASEAERQRDSASECPPLPSLPSAGSWLNPVGKFLGAVQYAVAKKSPQQAPPPPPPPQREAEQRKIWWADGDHYEWRYERRGLFARELVLHRTRRGE